jgi:hypothetical protein
MNQDFTAAQYAKRAATLGGVRLCGLVNQKTPEDNLGLPGQAASSTETRRCGSDPRWRRHQSADWYMPCMSQ